jgi:hypothetical protein
MVDVGFAMERRWGDAQAFGAPPMQWMVSTNSALRPIVPSTLPSGQAATQMPQPKQIEGLISGCSAL